MDFERPRRPGLFRLGPDGSSIELLFGECRSCKRLSFPHTPYGCPECGAPPEEVVSAPRAAEGRLLAFVTLHSEIVPKVAPGSVVGEVEIAPGLADEVMIGGSAEGLKPGMTLTGKAVPAEGAESGVFDCYFFPAEAA